MRIVPLMILASLGLLPGCSRDRVGDPPADGTSTDGPSVDPAAVDTPRADEPDLVRPSPPEGSGPAPAGNTPTRVVFLGTSLTEGLGLDRPEREAWPARVAELADSAGLAIEIVNAGLSGETSAGALARLEWVLSRAPEVLVVETGGNDALRGLPLEALESNLTAVVRRAREARPGVRVVLVQMEAPTNLGPDYTGGFRETYRRVADRERVPLVPFLLEGVAGIAALNQADRVHPTAEGHRIMARNAWMALEPVFRETLPR